MPHDSYLEHSALIVDDEEDICILLTSILKKINIIPSCANNLAEATAALKNVNPELIFLDNQLPDGTGMQYIRILKNKYPAVKIIMITAHDSAENRVNAMGIGADDFIGKPFSRDLIFESVQKVLSAA